MKLSDVARIVPLKLLRDGEFQSLGTLSRDDPQLLVTFYDAKYGPQLAENPKIACVVTRADLLELVPERLGVAVSDDPQTAFYAIHDHLLERTSFYGDSFDTVVAADASVHPTAYVAPRNVRIGSGSQIGPKAVILEGSKLGGNVVVGAGAVIGGEGFEPKNIGGRHVIVRHAGGVRLDDGVVVQANSHVAKAVFNGDTIVGADTKIDALVHIAHNVRIGRGCEIASGATLSGSVSVGDRVWIGPRAVISSELTIGDAAFIAIGSLVLRDVKPGDRVLGFRFRSSD